MPSGTLLPSDAYVTNAMLSVYAPGAPGFVPHTDHCGPADPRRITAVYYPNGAWDEVGLYQGFRSGFRVQDSGFSRLRG